jgi:N-acetylmuramoyl-L-alanine amidase
MFSRARAYFAVLLAVAFFGLPWFIQNYPDQVRGLASFFADVASQMASTILHNPRTVAELQAKYAGNAGSTPKINTKNSETATTPGSDIIMGETSATGTTSTTSITSIASTISSSIDVTDATDSEDILVVANKTLSSSSQIGSGFADLSIPKVRVLLVPGHEPGFGGAEFGTMKERLINTELSKDLYEILDADPHFQVFSTRNNEAWNPVFSKYFETQWDAIKQWQKDSHKEMLHLIAIGSTTKAVSKVFHNRVNNNAAYRLYGITKWANENNIDVVIHIHINDDPERYGDVPGKYSGFAIYVPVQQFSNSTTTKAVAEAIFNRLKMYNKISNLPGESSGIVDEPDLIAVGTNNTADAASMLIEYGYIYEPQFALAKRSETLKKIAYETYLGLKDFFENATTTQR